MEAEPYGARPASPKTLSTGGRPTSFRSSSIIKQYMIHKA